MGQLFSTRDTIYSYYNNLSVPIPFIPFKAEWEIQPKTPFGHTSLFNVRVKDDPKRSVSVLSDHYDTFGTLFNHPPMTPYWEVHNGFTHARVNLIDVKGLVALIEDMLYEELES